MKRYLVRAGMLPFDNFSIEEVIRDNTMGTNAGNLLFQTAVVKSVMTDEDVIFDAVTFRPGCKFDYAAINETYDAFLIPLANAFRVSFKGELNRLSRFVENLTIPCIVIGVGADGRIGGDVTVAAEEDCIKAIHRFMKAVLDRSSIVGVRGEVTGDFLKKIGYKEEEHFTVIGCPSMYYHGAKLPDNSRGTFSYESRISVSRKNNTPEKLHTFIEKQLQLFPDHYFVPQTLPDYKLVYAGEPYDMATKLNEKLSPNYPHNYDDKIFKENRALCFLNQKTWMDFLSSCDLCFGSRIHGNIAGVISGTPSIIFPADLRVLELARYHNIPHMPAADIDDDLDLIRLFNETDFTSIYKGHEERLEHYLDFMHQNGLETVFDKDLGTEPTPFDKKLNEIDFNGPVDSFISCDDAERMRRVVHYYSILEGEKDAKNERIAEEREKAAERQKTIKAQKKQIADLKKSAASDAGITSKVKRKVKKMLG